MLQSERFILNSNLPENDVSLVAVSENISPEAEEKLLCYGINVLNTHKDNRLPPAYSDHPDLQMFYYGQGVLFTNNHNIAGEREKDFSVKLIREEPKISYPNDVSTNCVRLKNLLICNEKTVSKDILEKAYSDNLQIVNVKQGYTKCSVCVIDENSIITDDESIYKSVQNFLDDVLLVSKGSVRLKGMNYGFIGGCSGKIHKNIIAFNGRLDSHKDHRAIESFIFKHDCLFIELSHKPLRDIGSIIPLKEYC